MNPEKIERNFKNYFPSPFSLAILLSLLTFLLALLFMEDEPGQNKIIALSNYWYEGLWDKGAGGLYFAFQMMLILVLGHTLALSKPFNTLIQKLLLFCTNRVNAVVVLSSSTILLGYLNWGLALIFGALFARKIGEYFQHKEKSINYALLGACGYLGLLVWHGGFSGSAPTKVMEADYLKAIGFESLSIPIETTLFSPLNIFVCILLLLLIPLVMGFISKRNAGQIPQLSTREKEETNSSTILRLGLAEKFEFKSWISKSLGVLILLVALQQAITYEGKSSMGFIQPNYINFCMLGLALIFHQNLNSFLKAIDDAIGGASGILIQFPLYFGILGILKGSGLIFMFTEFIITFASADSLPFFTFISAGIVNFFVPSGGGQWAIQGPIIIESAQQLNADLPKTVMAMAYGDELTNMLQPFWALPLLAVTKLKAYQILPFTFILFCIATLIFMSGLLLF
ncbi:short-chain fatty acids transporter [Lishizhenia tianjinensis]|uniref:Short-chain fatty acids transporter n=1 Tax=Lishizhenia tianjinensis TaxID=477690 RepID=A0A1I7A3A5_9FLAO|nr:TIGR00366 family protein [Lishizhenia tianjinensis]SFT69418.1 short-chain fatty acids transporter [Lishizhenia tianjinensis]